MLKSCKYCGRIHEENYICKFKPKRKDFKDKNNIDKFRSTRKWTRKSLYIKERDSNLCQICIRNLYNTTLTYNYKDLQVHHIIPIREEWDKRLEDTNLITLCPYHHKLAEIGNIKRDELLKIVIEQENNIPPTLIG